MKLRFPGDAHLNRDNNICRMSQGFQFEGKGNTNPDPWEDFPVLFCEILWGLWDHVMIFIIFSSTTIHSATFNLTHSMISPPSLGSGKNRNNWLNHLTLQSRGSPALICRLFTNPQISNLGLVHFPILPAQKSERVGTRAGCIFSRENRDYTGDPGLSTLGWSPSIVADVLKSKYINLSRNALWEIIFFKCPFFYIILSKLVVLSINIYFLCVGK